MTIFQFTNYHFIANGLSESQKIVILSWIVCNLLHALYKTEGGGARRNELQQKQLTISLEDHALANIR